MAVIKLKSAAEYAAKYKARVGVAGADYEAGVKNPRRSQEDAAVAAADNFAQGVQAAITDGRFAAGVEASRGKWARKAGTVGAQRFSPGAQAAAPDFQAGLQPMLAVLGSLDVDAAAPRFPRGDPRNFARVAVVGNALHAAAKK